MHHPSEVTVEFDELTDLPSMMYFRRHAGAYVRRARMRGRMAYLVYFNLENFSVFNERYGFEEGDRLLLLMSVAIQAAFPGYLLSRFSEDHFLLVCESINLEESILDVREQLHAYGRNANVELKAGIFCLEDDKLDIGTACDRAKIACDSIAHRYDRTFRWYDDELDWQVERSQYIESHIDRAVENGWIKVFFQPIVRSITGEVCEFEALARWIDPRYGFLSPAVFVDVLEKAHLIHKLDSCVIDQACSVWKKMSTHESMLVPVSVNLSRLDFELTDAFSMVENTVARYEMPRQMLHVEVTESALNENTEELVHDLERFRRAGYQVWLDDFGSGYSSLNTLKDYVFDVVKIDMAFLREFESKPQSRVIIASVVNMAKQLGMQTLIEGVETPEQFEFLCGIGCEFVQGYLVGKPLSYEDNLKRIHAGELTMGDAALHGYYDRLGSINSLSATPFEFPWETRQEDRPLAEMLPLALVEREGAEVRFMTSNDVFGNVLRELGVGNMSRFAERISKGSDSQSRVLLRTIDTAIVTRGIESVDVLVNGQHCVLRVRYVASHANVHALLLSFMNLSRFSNVGEEKRVQISLQYLYTVYDEVNIVDIADGTVSTLYRGNTSFPTAASGAKMVDVTRDFVSGYVHPEDRDRCMRYLDVTTIDKRLEVSGKSYLADAFRTLRPNGTYGWIASVLVPVLIDGGPALLVCVRQTNDDLVETLRQETKISKSLLWDTLIDLVPAGIFWKDADRRFLGVNKNFLDFYSFSSTNDVLGKTDEDMGWHVDADPFMNNELRVIRDGEPVLNTPGTCISQGEVRHIQASKIPLKRNGEVVGLLGYFTDQTTLDVNHSLMSNGFDRMAETDHLTGIPNQRGFMSSLASYQDVYENGGPRYVCTVCDILGMGDLNHVYGRSFGNRILKVVSLALTHAYGVNGVVARVGGDKFAMLRQVSDDEGLIDEVERMRGVVEGVNEVDGLYVNLRCFVGSATPGQGMDAGDVLKLAEKRMNDERSAYFG